MTKAQVRKVSRMQNHHPCTIAEVDDDVFVISHNKTSKKDSHYLVKANGKISLITIKE